MARTTRFTRRKLPHWEVEGGRYFITVRCADSLPRDAVLRLAELQRTLAAIEPRSQDFATLQRHIFRTLEKFLDAGCGACPLSMAGAAEILINEFEELREWNVSVPHYTVMPNHWHALLVPHDDCERTLADILRCVKGRSARAINALRGSTGPFWQREWFDHWIRHDAEWERCVQYIRANPVKAGLVREWSQHPWTK